MVTINLMSLGDYPEDFIDMKRDIESKLLNNGTITERYKFPDFIGYISADTIIYSHGECVIPFTIHDGQNDKYLVYTLDEDTDEKIYDDFICRLKSVDFNISKLTEKKATEVLSQINLDKDPVFIRNGRYFV